MRVLLGVIIGAGLTITVWRYWRDWVGALLAIGDS